MNSIRSLLCTSTNSTPHERFFQFQRRSSHGNSLPSWLMNPGPVMLRRFVRTSKTDPLVDEVELLDSNPSFARVRYPGGKESSVSVRDLAPCPSESGPQIPEDSSSPPLPLEDMVSPSKEVTLRRSTRVSKPPERYGVDS
eukprot:TRINITY_DN5230_c0_g1_i13.p2 TRINITY_DN5230_c0_g1~~TRINITY_DN5230_c0_g1_i13.p2  ORF type:complete len:140 (+),score=4.75 TRINITY_DN5230_c0_g1_i13:2063-2482(+)